MTKPLWFGISLTDCNGQILASWNYDEIYPVIPPYFTYPNEDGTCPYYIEFRHLTYTRDSLPANININHAIHEATQAFIKKVKK